MIDDPPLSLAAIPAVAQRLVCRIPTILVTIVGLRLICDGAMHPFGR